MERETGVRPPDERITRTLSTLEERWNVGVDIDALASAVHVTKSRLQHLFKAHTGTSIGQWVRERRLREAAHLIATTDEHIAQIAYAVGFSDPSNFNHAFKERFGVNPRAYRTARRSAPGPRQH